MGSILDIIKKGISALNPPKTPKPPNPKILGPKGTPVRDVAEKAKSRNQQTEDANKELDKS